MAEPSSGPYLRRLSESRTELSPLPQAGEAVLVSPEGSGAPDQAPLGQAGMQRSLSDRSRRHAGEQYHHSFANEPQGLAVGQLPQVPERAGEAHEGSSDGDAVRARSSGLASAPSALDAAGLSFTRSQSGGSYRRLRRQASSMHACMPLPIMRRCREPPLHMLIAACLIGGASTKALSLLGHACANVGK